MVRLISVESNIRPSRPISSQTIDAIELRRKKNARKPVQICLLILGERGSGKSTFINNLCNWEIYEEEKSNEFKDPRYAHLPPKLQLVQKHIDLSFDECAPIILDLVTFQGFGDGFNNIETSSIVNEYLEKQFDEFIEDEEQIQRKTKSHDTRPHACIYFIKPNSRGLKDFDVDVLKKISNKVNIIPVLSKADILSSSELEYNRQLILTGFKENNINIYDFGDDRIGDIFSSINDYYYQKVLRNMRINDIVPFALSCSQIEHKPQKKNREHNPIREYEWGKLAIEDVCCSNFIFLKGILLGSHIQDLKDHTHNVLYETYRTIRLLERRCNERPKSSGKNSNRRPEVVPNEKPKEIFALEFKQFHNPKAIDSIIHEKKQILQEYERKLVELETKKDITTIDNNC